MRRQMSRGRAAGALAVSLGLMSVAAAAASGSVVFTGSDAFGRAASANFSVSGSSLIIRLTNTSAADVMQPIDVLTGVYFDIAGAPIAFSRTSAVLGAGSSVLFGSSDPGGVVGGEWAFKGGLSGGPRNAAYGASASGLGLFGPSDRFPGNNLQQQNNVGGLEYGITSAGDNPATGNTPVTGPNALIKNEVVFTLGGLPQGFALGSIGNVSFQYGTDLSEPNIPGVPTPGAAALAGVAGLIASRRRR